MIGVVYEVTIEDYSKIIASEGGGVGYQDVVVDCAALPAKAPTLEWGLEQDGKPVRAHTLLAPPQSVTRAHGFDPSYAQPSARYLGLITTGAVEHELPSDYMKYLQGIRPYKITTLGQRTAKVVFASVWWLLLMVLFTIGKMAADKDGKAPAWLGVALNGTFKILWRLYDTFIKRMFGDGERTIGDMELMSPTQWDGKS